MISIDKRSDLFKLKRMSLLDWLKNFLIPPCECGENTNIEHPLSNTTRKRLMLGGMDTIRYDLPFRLKVGIFLTLIFVVAEFVVCMIVADMLRDYLADNYNQATEYYDTMEKSYMGMEILCNSIPVANLTNACLEHRNSQIPSQTDTSSWLVDDLWSSADAFYISLVLGTIIGQLMTIWFMYAYVTGTIQKMRLLREGKRVLGFTLLDIQQLFGLYSSSTYIGAVLSFYVGGTIISVLLWFIVVLCFAWSWLWNAFTLPLFRWMIYFVISYVLNMVFFQGYIFQRKSAIPDFNNWFKNSSLYYLVDFLVLLYFIPYMAMVLMYKILYGLGILLGLIFRMDLTNYGEGMESMDSGFVATMAVLALNERENNPIIRVFSRIVFPSPAMNNIDGARRIRSPRVSHVARNRWFLAYTLIKNPSIVAHRRIIDKQIRTKIVTKSSMSIDDRTSKDRPTKVSHLVDEQNSKSHATMV